MSDPAEGVPDDFPPFPVDEQPLVCKTVVMLDPIGTFASLAIELQFTVFEEITK